VIELEGGRYVISPYGEVDWVRNVRAAGTATLTRGRHTEQITAIELTPEEAAPILRHALTIAPAFIRSYFAVTAASSIEAIVQEAPRHPVFELVGTLATKPAAPDPTAAEDVESSKAG
jgi:hypothetical protein